MGGGIRVSEEITVIGLTGQDGHLTADALEKLRRGDLSDDALLFALEHIGKCEQCAQALASGYDTLAEVPAGFEEELQKKLNMKRQKKREFAFYVLRVTIAASIALIITFSSAFNTLTENKLGTIKAPDDTIVNQISSNLRSFSKNIVNMEVINHVAKKK